MYISKTQPKSISNNQNKNVSHTRQPHITSVFDQSSTFSISCELDVIIFLLRLFTTYSDTFAISKYNIILNSGPIYNYIMVLLYWYRASNLLVCCGCGPTAQMFTVVVLELTFVADYINLDTLSLCWTRCTPCVHCKHEGKVRSVRLMRTH